MRTIAVIAATLALLALPATADHCETYSTSSPEVDTGDTPAGRFYVDNDLCQIGCLFSVWVYQESNGIDGLQRGDEVVDDTCHGMIEADVIDA